MKSSLLMVAVLVGTAGLSAESLVYKVDPVHSGINFKIRHFVNKVPGAFTRFQGEIHHNPENPAENQATAVIHVDSVDTRNDDRDEHLQSEDFFKASQHPKIEFTSTKWTATGENTWDVEGILKMVGREKPIVLQVTYLGEMAGKETIRSGWEGKATIDRTEWGMEYGTPFVGEDVEIELNIQAHRELEETAK